MDREQLVRDVAEVLNRHSLENRSNTPDFILAETMVRALETFEWTSNRREQWYGRGLRVGGAAVIDPETGRVLSQPPIDMNVRPRKTRDE